MTLDQRGDDEQRSLCAACLREAKFWVVAKDPARLAADLRSAGVRDVHAAATLADFAPTIAAVCLGQLGDWTRLLVSGNTGRGKSHLAAALMRVWTMRGEQPRMVLARQLFRRIWSTYRDDSHESEADAMESLCGAAPLVIDDLGPGREGRVTEAVIGALHEILTRRLDHRRSTVVTTNYALDEIETWYGQAIASRLESMTSLVLDGDDRRLA